MACVKIISGHTNPGGSTVAHINLCNLFNDNGIDAVFYGPHDWHLGKCRADKTSNLEFNDGDFVVMHYLVMPERPPAVEKVILSCHEKHNYPIKNINRFWDDIHFVSASQRDWQQVQGVVIPNRISSLEHKNICNKVAGVIGSIQPHKKTHVSIERALNSGYGKVLVYGVADDRDYYVSMIEPFVHSGQVEIRDFEDDKQKMYDSVEAVFHSSESETFNFIRAECAATGTRYHGVDASNPDVTLYSDREILDAWKNLLGMT